MGSISSARWAVRVLGLAMLVMGLAIWTGAVDALIPIHMLVGFVFVLSLWWLAYLGYRAGASPALVVVAVVLGAILPLLGLTQAQLLPDGAHWIVQIVHLALGVIAIGMGEAIASSEAREATI